jgi:predicted Zn finger-like uncharacterized protein
VSRRDPAASRSSSSTRRGGAPRPRTDGKIDVQCPQCAAAYRIPADQLDAKIECGECHRVFFAKTTAGKKIKPPDNTKMYVGFGIGALALIGILVGMSMGGGEKPKAAPPPPPKVEPYGRGNHPRTLELLAWARAIAADNRLVLDRHSDHAALAPALGVAADPTAVVAALQTHESTKFLRELQCDSAELLGDADMTAPAGKAIVYISTKPGDDTYEAKFRGELELSFRMDGAQTRVTGIAVKLPPVRRKPDPSKQTYVPVKDIAKPQEKEITDSAGTRKVKESQPAAVPHWEQATPQQREKADAAIAMILESANTDAPGGLFNKATMGVQTLDDKKAVVPRALNAMFELYGDANANNMKLSQLDRALRAWTGFAVNYDPADSGDAAKDKAARESCVRQWFAYWYRYGNTELKDNIEDTESLEMPVKKTDAPAKTGK